MKTKIIVLISVCPEVLSTQAGLLVKYLIRNNYKVEQKIFSSKISPVEYIDEALFDRIPKTHSGHDNWIIIQDLSSIEGFQCSPNLHVLADLFVLLDIQEIGDEEFNKRRESLLVKANKYNWSIAIGTKRNILNQELIDLVDHL